MVHSASMPEIRNVEPPRFAWPESHARADQENAFHFVWDVGQHQCDDIRFGDLGHVLDFLDLVRRQIGGLDDVSLSFEPLEEMADLVERILDGLLANSPLGFLTLLLRSDVSRF